MTVDAEALRELLDRAVQLDVKAEGLLEAEPGDDVFLEPAPEVPPAAEIVPPPEERFEDRLAALEAVVAAWQVSTPVGVDPVADEEAALDEVAEKGFDFAAEEDEEPSTETKDWGKCPECGSEERDEFADGTARCMKCGHELAQTKDDDLMEWAEGFVAEHEEKSEPVAEEQADLSDLLARRARLG